MKKTGFVVAFGFVALVVSGCGPVMHAEMMTEAITNFSNRVKTPPTEKIWVTNLADSACDRGCASCGSQPAGKKGLLGGISLGGSKDGTSPHDRLAYEIISNYLTQKKKARVVETHRHNYATELNPETHRKVELLTEKVSTTSCEDLCMIDEAKKRKADKVLVYHILEISNDKMKIHFRLSNVASGVVEAAHTLKVEGLRAHDESFGELNRGGGGGTRAARNNEASQD